MKYLYSEKQKGVIHFRLNYDHNCSKLLERRQQKGNIKWYQQWSFSNKMMGGWLYFFFHFQILSNEQVFFNSFLR